MTAKAEIFAAPYSLARVFGDEFAFSIPYYQRPYAWSEEEAGALLADLRVAMGQDPIPVDKVPAYFLGTIVLDQSNPPAAQIVDGQQRLTTLTILFAVLRELLPRKQAEQLISHIWRTSAWGHVRAPRLSLRGQADTRFFRTYIQEAGGLAKLQHTDSADLPDSQQRLAAVARYFLEQIEPLTPAERQRLMRFALTRCLLIVVATPSRDSSFTIFTVLNKRGLDLSTVDILKADILGEIEKSVPERDVVEDYAARWEDLEQSLGRDGFADLISYTRAIKHNARAEVAVLKEFRQYVIGERQGAQLAEVLDETLEPLGQALYIVRNGTYYKHGANKKTIRAINRLFGWLNRIEQADWTPAAIEYLRQHHAEPELLLAFFGDLERLCAYIMLRGWNADQRGRRYRGLLAEIIAGATAPAKLQLSREERKDMYARLDGDIYNRSGRVRRYVLLRLDDALAGGSVTYRDEDTITVEHVLPQNPHPKRTQWLVAWKRCWASPSVRKEWVNRLANLVLLYKDPNTRAGNLDFAEKQQVYFPERDDMAGDEGQAPFALTNTLRGLDDWSVETVARRQAELLARLNDLWRLGHAQQGSQGAQRQGRGQGQRNGKAGRSAAG